MESVAVQPVCLAMPRECVCWEVLKSFLCLCALGLGWVEQHSGAFAEKVHFLHFADIQWYKKVLLGEGSVPQQSTCVTGDTFESKDQTVVSIVIITIKYNSAVESQL